MTLDPSCPIAGQWKQQQVLGFAALVRVFQVAQKLSKREVLSHRLIEVDYRFGQGETTQFLGNLNALDRQKAETFKTWVRLRSQVARIKLLVLGEGKE